MTKAELTWRLRRSLLELDILFKDFYLHEYEKISATEKKQFGLLLLQEDLELLALLRNSQEPLWQKIRYCQEEKGML